MPVAAPAIRDGAHLFTFVLCLLSFLCGSLFRLPISNSSLGVTTAQQSGACAAAPRANSTTFTQVAESSSPVTDKVAHGYGLLYDSYFGQDAQQQPIKLLEIGLGCGMPYGPGASSQIWPRLFPHGEIWFAEHDKGCVEKYWSAQQQTWKYVTGDQANVTDVESWAATTGDNFDFIIDDGGHTNPMIWTSFTYLFQHGLKPGGVYFLEDICVGRDPAYFDGGIPGGNGTVVFDAVSDWMDQLVMSTAKTLRHRLPAGGVSRVDCVRGMCAITKDDRSAYPSDLAPLAARQETAGLRSGRHFAFGRGGRFTHGAPKSLWGKLPGAGK